MNPNPVSRQVAVNPLLPEQITVRHPLGLPAGSVRALLAFMVFGTVWALLLLPEKPDTEIRVPQYLYFLMFLILGHYFAVRSHSPAKSSTHEPPPLYLPRGSLRFLMIAGFAAAFAWGFYNNPKFFDRLSPRAEEQPYLPLILVGAFFVGIILARLANQILAGPRGLPSWFQDVTAWVSLLALVFMSIELIVHLVINPTLSEGLVLPHWEGFLGAFVAFYFGLRS